MRGGVNSPLNRNHSRPAGGNRILYSVFTTTTEPLALIRGLQIPMGLAAAVLGTPYTHTPFRPLAVSGCGRCRLTKSIGFPKKFAHSAGDRQANYQPSDQKQADLLYVPPSPLLPCDRTG